MSKYIDVKKLERRSAYGIVKAFVDDHLKDKACSLATMQSEILDFYGFELGKSNLHKIIMQLIYQDFVERKKVGNTYYYYSKDFITR